MFFKINLDENMVNMKVLRIFETNNFYFGVILIRTSLLSQKSVGLEEHIVARLELRDAWRTRTTSGKTFSGSALGDTCHLPKGLRKGGCVRSEEHTSELQSHHDLVCR